MELTVISGKGGTGKTTIAMALSTLYQNCNMADCDVDASNLYLYFESNDIKKEYFYAGKLARIDERFCTECGKCEQVCKFDAIKDNRIDPFKCEGCGACTLVCPENAIELKDKKAATAYITKIGDGYLSRAQMEIGSDGSGKLVTHLRKRIRDLSDPDTVIIIDGSPGIGCPVISSITATDMVLIVTEPTMSGLSDFLRVAELCEFFGIKMLACINKYDINEQIGKDIENYCIGKGIELVGKVPYDDMILKSINELKPITEYPLSEANKAIRIMWDKIKVYTNEIIKKREGEEIEL